MLLGRGTAMGGVLLAAVMVFMTAAYFSPVADFALFSLTSLCIATMVMHSGYRGGLMLYFAASVMIFVFWGIFFALPFVGFFGIYPILKGLVENRNKRVVAFMCKILIFTAVSAIGTTSIIVLSDGIQLQGVAAKLQEICGRYWVVAAGTAAVVLLVIYDKALTLAIGVIGKFLPLKH